MQEHNHELALIGVSPRLPAGAHVVRCRLQTTRVRQRQTRLMLRNHGHQQRSLPLCHAMLQRCIAATLPLGLANPRSAARIPWRCSSDAASLKAPPAGPCAFLSYSLSQARPPTIHADFISRTASRPIVHSSRRGLLLHLETPKPPAACTLHSGTFEPR